MLQAAGPRYEKMVRTLKNATSEADISAYIFASVTRVLRDGGASGQPGRAETIEELLYGPREEITEAECNAIAVVCDHRMRYDIRELWEPNRGTPVVARVRVWGQELEAPAKNQVVMAVDMFEAGKRFYRLGCDHDWVGRCGSIRGPSRGITDFTCSKCGAHKTYDSSD